MSGVVARIDVESFGAAETRRVPPPPLARPRMDTARRPRARHYPLAGALLAFIAPLGLLALRAITTARLPTSSWILAELVGSLVFYVYTTTFTAAVLVLIGRWLGAREDWLSESTLTDVLTGVANRRHFDERLREETSRAHRYGTSLALVLIDLDGFKAINDTCGHEAGDGALKLAAACFRRTCRATDVVARYGGDEFAILSPLTTATEALALAERIRAAMARMRTNTPDAHVPTTSIGVGDVACAETPTPDALFAAADRALYQAKAMGRDRVVLAPPARRPHENARENTVSR